MIKTMIYDEETDTYYLNDSHMKNCKAAAELLKKQKPFTREEAESQLQRNQASSALNESLKKVTNNKDCIEAVVLTLDTVNHIKLMIDWIGRHQKDNPTDRTLIYIAKRISAIARDHWLEKIETYYYPNGAVKEVIEYFTQWRALKTDYDEDGKVINTSEILKNYGSRKENQRLIFYC